MTYLLWTIIIIFLVYAFQGLLSFPFWFFGVIFNFFNLPLQLISQTIYPVWILPYLVLYWSVAFIIFHVIISYFHHK